MQFPNYFFASVISFLGLLIGIFLIRIAPEEQKPLKKYFIISRRLLLLLIFAFIFFYFIRNNFYILALIIFFIFALFVEYKTKDLLRKSAISYAVLGILFFFSLQSSNLFVIESSLILLYGVPTASLMHNGKNHYKIISCNLGFVIIANLLYLSSYHFSFLTPR